MPFRPRPRTLAAAAPLAVALALAAPPAAAQPAKGSPPEAAPARVVDPKPLAPLTAPYPEGAKGNAVVVVAIVVNADGTVRKARAVSGEEPFVSAAIAASSGWRFAPATREGKPLA